MKLFPLYLTSEQNSGLLDFANDTFTTKPRKQIGIFSLKQFTKTDIRNFNANSHFVFDLSALEETGQELLTSLKAVSLQVSVRIILIALKYEKDDDFLSKLVNAGFTNIVTEYRTGDKKSDIKAMRDDILECFSKDGLSPKKVRTYNKEPQSLDTLKQIAVEEEKPTFGSLSSGNGKAVKIGVLGSMERTGTTSLSIHICDYLSRHGAVAAYKNAVPKHDNQLDFMKVIFQPVVKKGYFEYSNIHFFGSKTQPPLSAYNAVIYDFGSITKTGAPEGFEDCDIHFIVGGTKFQELPFFLSAMSKYTHINIIASAVFTPAESYGDMAEILSENLNKVIFLPYSPSLFNADENDSVLDDNDVFGRFADEKANSQECDLEL